MTGKLIYLFMWGYQETYRLVVRSLAREVLKELGADADAEVLLVGVRAPDSKNRNPVCIEPEDGKWPLSLLNGLLESVELTYQNHESQRMFYTDEASMRDKPEWIRRDSVRTSVANAIKVFDADHDVISLCGEARRIGDYYVTPIVQIPNTTFAQCPALPLKQNEDGHRGYGFRSLIHAAMSAVLHEATEELHNPDPGRFARNSVRNAEEIVRIAAKNFLHTPGLSIDKRYLHTDLFNLLNLVSSLMYEGVKGIGQLIIVDPENEAVDFLVRFAEPVPLNKPRWVRKVLQMATTGVDIIADSQRIYGLGSLKDSHDPNGQDAFTVVFIDHYHWELRCGDQVLLRSHYAAPKLPQEPFNKTAFMASYKRLFPHSSDEDGLHLWKLLKVQIHQDHGSMIVVAEDAVSEAKRLSQQGTIVTPVRLSELLLRSVSGIDGTILLDPHGFCHAIGVILDGEANDECSPSRGSRYNSGVRYAQPKGPRRMAIIVSDDRTVDMIPAPRRLVSRRLIENNIAALEGSTLDSYHDSKNWLDKHRFYIDANQCERINGAIKRLDELPREVGLLYWGIETFDVNPEMDESYFCD